MLAYLNVIVFAQEGPAVQEVNRVLAIFDSFSPIFRTLIGIFVLLIFLYFFWGLVDYIRKDDASLEDAKKRMMWGVVGIFVLVSMWGLLFFLQTTVLGAGKSSDIDIQFRRVELPKS